MATYPNPRGLAVKGLKMWATDDGGGYQCRIAIGKYDVALVTNDGNGGPIDIRPIGPDGERELASLRELCATIPPMEYEGMKIPIDAEIYVDALVSAADAAKRFAAKLARYKKTCVCFRVPGDDPLGFRTVKIGRHSLAVVLKYVADHYPTAEVL